MGSVRRLGTRDPGFVAYGAADDRFTARLADLLADHDDALVAAYRPVRESGAVPAADRPQPLDRKQYLLHVLRRVPG